MVDVRPFRAIRYSEKAGGLRNLITQPYDKTTPSMQDAYYERSPYNVVRITLNLEKRGDPQGLLVVHEKSPCFPGQQRTGSHRG